MKPYIITTGTIFGLITLAHIWRMFEESGLMTREPSYILLTLASAALSVWAWWLVFRKRSS